MPSKGNNKNHMSMAANKIHIVIFFFGLLTTAAAFFFLAYTESQDYKIRFAKNAQIRASLVIETMQYGEINLEMVSKFFEGSEEVTDKELEIFTLPVFKHSSLDVISYLQRIENSRRLEFERTHKKLHGGIESQIKIPAEGGLFTRAPAADHYFPVIMVKPGGGDYEDNRHLDVSFEAHRKNAIKNAVQTGSPYCTGRVSFYKKGAALEGYIVYVPVIKNGSVVGLVEGKFSSERLFKEAISDTPLMNLHTSLWQDNAGGRELIYKWDPRRKDSEAGFFIRFLYPQNVSYTQEFVMTGKKWAVTVKPGDYYVTGNFSPVFYSVLPAGVLLTLLLVYLIQLLNIRRQTAEELARMKEAAFQSTKSELDRFFELSIDLLCIANTGGFFIRLNPEWQKTLGYDRSELEKSRFLDFVHPEDMQGTLKAVQELAEGKPIANFVNRYRTKDGSYRWIEWRSAPAKEGGLIYAAARDITETINREKERENFIKELEDKNAELERFTYTVSHDLKNPIITINGFAGALEKHMEKCDRDNITKDIAYIKGAASTMNSLLNELLALSRYGRPLTNPERVLFGDIADEAVVNTAGEITQKKAEVNIDPSLRDRAKEGVLVKVDRQRMVEVLQNLIANGIKFAMPGERPVIDIGVKCGYNNKGVVFYVRDNGIGIEKQYHEKVFGLFERLDTGTEGAGIGLPIVKRVIEKHNGKIWIESDGKGRGSVFYFTIGEI